MILKNEIVVDKEKYFKTHFSIINSTIQNESMKLVEKEMEVLSAFLSLDKNITKDDMFNSLARKQVKEMLNNMSAGSLSNHIRHLLEKGYLTKDSITNKISMRPAFIPEEPVQGYNIKLKQIDNKDE